MAELAQVLARLDRIEGKLDTAVATKAEHDKAIALLDKRIQTLEAADVERKATEKQVTLWQGALGLLGGLSLLFGTFAALAKVMGWGSK